MDDDKKRSPENAADNVGRIEFNDPHYRPFSDTPGPPEERISLELMVLIDIRSRLDRLEKMVFGESAQKPSSSQQMGEIKSTPDGAGGMVYRFKVSPTDWVVVRSTNAVVTSAFFENATGERVAIDDLAAIEHLIEHLPIYVRSNPDPTRNAMNDDH